MKIGLVGESPHDTTSVENLLSRIYPDYVFFDMIPDIHGSQLDQQQPTKQRLRIEFQFEKPDLVIFIRDLDSLRKDFSQYRRRVEYFRNFKTVVNNKAIYLLFIYEIEAMIFCDLDTFGSHYSCSCELPSDPHDIERPKEQLKQIHKKYTETDNPEIFKKLNINVLKEKSTYFDSFLKKLDKILSN